MTENKKIQHFQQGRRNSTSKTPKNTSRKQKFHFIRTDPFLTDNQTEDQTHSSSDLQILQIRYLQSTIKALQQQNQQIKQELQIYMKQAKNNKSHYINKLQYTEIQNQLQSSLIQRDFLARNNKYLKAMCENYINEIAQLRMNIKLNSHQGYFRNQEILIRNKFNQKDKQQRFRPSSTDCYLNSNRSNNPQNQKKKENYQDKNVKTQMNFYQKPNNQYFSQNASNHIKGLMFRQKSKKKNQSPKK